MSTSPFDIVLAELRRAKHEHPDFKPTLGEAMDVLDEEYNELFKAVIARDLHGEHGVIAEAGQVAAVAIRIIEKAQAMTEVPHA